MTDDLLMIRSTAGGTSLIYNRPIVGIASSYIAGTFLGFLTEASLNLLLYSVMAFLLSGSVFYLLAGRLKKDILRLTGLSLLLASLTVIGWISADIYKTAGPEKAVAVIRQGDADNVKVEGIVVSDPDIKYKKGSVGEMFTFRVSAMISGDQQAELKRTVIRVMVNNVPRRKLIAYGDKLVIDGSIREFGPADSDMKNPVTALRRMCLVASYNKTETVSRGNGSGFMEMCFGLRKSAAGYLSYGIEGFRVTVSVIRSLVLGYRSDVSKEINQMFIDTGTLHVFAISGMHVAVIAGFLLFILKAARITIIRWPFFLVPMIVIYTIATGASASAIRSCLMAVIFFMAPIFMRKADVISALFASALMIVAVDPVEVFDAGCVLSFVAVGGIVILYPLIEARMKRYWEPDGFMVRDEPAQIQGVKLVVRYILTTMAISVCAWLVSTPLIAYYFGRVSLVALPANLVIVPLSVLLLLSGCLSLVLGPCAWFFADIFNHASLAIGGLMVKIAELMASIPYGSFETDRVTILFVVCWYILLGILVWRLRIPRAMSEDKK